MRVLTAWLVIVLALGAVATRASARPSDFFSAANRICREESAHNQTDIPQGGPKTAKALVALLLVIDRDGRRLIVRLKALTPPPEYRPQFTTYLNDLNALLKDAESLRKTIAAGSSRAQLKAGLSKLQHALLKENKDADNLGLTDCIAVL